MVFKALSNDFKLGQLHLDSLYLNENADTSVSLYMYSKDAVAARGVCDRGGQSKCEKYYCPPPDNSIVTYVLLITIIVRNGPSNKFIFRATYGNSIVLQHFSSVENDTRNV
jgi:hypothetical protein